MHSGPPPGVELAYDVAAAKLSQLLADIDQLDSKAGVVVSVLVAAAGAFLLATHLPFDWRVVVASLLGLAIIAAAGAFLVRRYEDAPNADVFVRYAEGTPAQMKERFIQNLLDARRQNRQKVFLKGLLLKIAITLAGLAGVAAVTAVAGGVNFR